MMVMVTLLLLLVLLLVVANPQTQSEREGEKDKDNFKKLKNEKVPCDRHMGLFFNGFVFLLISFTP
jgi:hypothetical protein